MVSMTKLQKGFALMIMIALSTVIAYIALWSTNELDPTTINYPFGSNSNSNNFQDMISVTASEYAENWDTTTSWASLTTTLEDLYNDAIKSIKENKSHHKNNKTYYLDIASGPGQITAMFAEPFDYFMTVEPNPMYHETYQKTVFASIKDKYLGNIDKVIQDININNEFKGIKFDLITFIHSFYYVEIEDFFVVLTKLYTLLNDGGRIIIPMCPMSLDRESDWAKIMYEFLGFHYDPLKNIYDIASKFDGAKVEVVPDVDDFDTEYYTIQEAIEDNLWVMMEELSFARKYKLSSLKDKAAATNVFRQYLTRNCFKTGPRKCKVTGTAGHIVIIKNPQSMHIF